MTCTRTIGVFGKMILLLPLLSAAYAAEGDPPGITPDVETADYHVVTHHQVTIKRPAADVYPHVVDFGSWIGFDFVHVAGPDAGEGAIYRLYRDQDFFFQITRLIPDKLVVGVNLPSDFQGEQSSGVAVISLIELEGETVVTVTMSRQYDWTGEGPNPNQKARASKEFQENTRIMWEERFLPRLAELAGHED